MKALERAKAGRELAIRLAGRQWHNPVVVAIPPGGVAIGVEIARRLQAPLDVASALEVVLPGPRGIRLGAVAAGVFVAGRRIPGLDRDYLHRLVEHDIRCQLLDEFGYRGNQAPVEIANRDVILVDDGWATPTMVEAIVEGLRRRGPRTVTFATAECQTETQKKIEASVSVVSLYPSRPCRDVLFTDERLRQMTHGEAARLIASTRGVAAQPEPAINSIPGVSAASQACNVKAVHSGSHS